MTKEKTVLFVVCIALGVLFYFQCFSQKKKENTHETFVAAGAMQHLGSVEYDLLPMAQDSHELLAAPDFASLIDSGDHAVQAIDSSDAQRPLERLQSLSDSYAPVVSSHAIPFSMGAAKPLVHSFSVNAPRVNLKGKLYEMNLSSAVRGSVGINIDPNVSLVSKSRYAPSDSYTAGFMTPVFDSMYDKLSGSYRNMPLHTAGAGQAGGVGGNQIDLIMDM